MCGRFTITQTKEELEDYFGVTVDEEYAPRYNAAPSQKLPVILNTDPEKVHMVQWGIKPIWFKEGKSDGLINIRTENLREKKTFKADLEKRRCIVLADGFYEWQKTVRGKQPYRIMLKNKKPFVFAGLWQIQKKEGREIPTFAILTTTPNSVLIPIHTRMPVMLGRDDARRWLMEPDLNILQPMASEKIGTYKVSPVVNKTTFDSETLIEPLEELNSK